MHAICNREIENFTKAKMQKNCFINAVRNREIEKTHEGMFQQIAKSWHSPHPMFLKIRLTPSHNNGAAIPQNMQTFIAEKNSWTIKRRTASPSINLSYPTARRPPDGPPNSVKSIGASPARPGSPARPRTGNASASLAAPRA